MKARRRGVHEIVIQLTSLEIKQFFLHEKQTPAHENLYYNF